MTGGQPVPETTLKGGGAGLQRLVSLQYSDTIPLGLCSQTTHF